MSGGASESGTRWKRDGLSPVLLAFLLLAEIALIWHPAAVPTNDGPSHLYSAWVWRQLAADPTGHLSEYFRRNPRRIYPNACYSWFLEAVIGRVSVQAAQKMGMTLYLIALPLAVGAFARALKRPPWLPAICAVGLSLNFLFFMGFLNFLWGVPLVFGFLAVERRILEAPGWWRLAAANLLLAATFCAHLVAFGAALLGAGVLILLVRGGRRLWGLAGALPVALLSPFFWPATVDPEQKWIWQETLRERLSSVLGMHIASAFGEREERVALLAGLVLLPLAVWGILRAREGRRELAGFASLLLVGAVAFPSAIGSGSYLDERMIVFFWLTLAAGVSVANPLLRRVVAVGIAALIVAHLLFLVRVFAGFDRDLVQFLSGMPELASSDGIFAVIEVPRSQSFVARPMATVEDYYFMALDKPNFDHYQAAADSAPQFPIAYTDAGLARYPGDRRMTRVKLRRVTEWAEDFLIWGDPMEVREMLGEEGYRLTFQNGMLQIFHRDQSRRAAATP